MFESLFSHLEMEPEGFYPEGPALLIVGRVIHMLKIETRKEPWKETGAIIGFPDALRSIFEASVADQKIMAAQRQILRVHA